MSEPMTRERALERAASILHEGGCCIHEYLTDTLLAIQAETEARVATECAEIAAQFGNTGRIGTSDHAAPRIRERFNLGSAS